MAKSKKSGKKKAAASVNFKGTDSGGRSIKDGWAVGKIVEAELTTAKESGNEMFKIVIQAKNGKQKAKVWDNLVLTPNALWKMRSLLEAAGVEVDEEEDMEFTAEDLLDLDEFDVELVNEEYENRMRPRVVSFATLGTQTDEDEDGDNDDDEEDEDEKPSKKKSKKKSKSDDDDEDEDEDEEEDDEEDDDEEDEDEEPPAKSKKKSKKSSKDDDEDDEDDDSEDEDEDEDDDEEDEDEKPKKKGKKSKAKLRAGQKVKFEDDKGRTKSGVITSVDDDTVFVEDAKGGEWELSTDEIIS